jgi:hypothetical protein
MALRGRTALLGLVCWVTAGVYAQQTIYVNGTTGNDAWDGLCETWDGGTCGPKGTIQAGIDAAVEGDTALVADGTYTGTGNKNLDFGGKAITVVSANGPESCIIDCENDGRAFYFHSGEPDGAVVDGLTITNGSALRGGGVYCVDSRPTLANCIIVGNAATAEDDAMGGGVYCSFSYPTITRCTITGNTAAAEIRARGGGVFCWSAGNVTLAACTITGNTVFTESFGAAGGGVCCEGGASVTITSCVITANAATAYGWADAASGGGVAVASSATITNCTIVDNMASGTGGGIWAGDASVTITNCVLWEDTPDEVDGYYPAVTYCDVQDGWPGAGNIDSDPFFVRSPNPGPDGEWGTSDDDYGDVHVTAASPCVDAGDNGAPGLAETDFDGEPRVQDCRVDIGADESPYFADCNANGVGDACDIADGASDDCTGNGIPDECEPDCNENGVADSCDIAAGTSQDCTGNGIPDECEPDCNANGFADSCDIAGGTSQDCNYNGVPDECEPQEDCNGNGVQDICDIATGFSGDCNGNSVPDECDVSAGTSSDCDANGVPDECESGDCNGNGVPDMCEILWDPSRDCNWNGVPDECDLADGTSLDCNANGAPDECDLANCISTDVNANSIPDECESVGDVNCDGVTDLADINPFVLYLSRYTVWQAEFPGCDPLNGDINGDGTYGQESFGDINPFVDLITHL